MRKLIDYQHYVSTCPPLHSERLVVVMMFTQNTVRQRPVSEQFDRTVKVLFQPFGGDPRIGMIIQSFVDTGDRFHLLQHRADVVTDFLYIRYENAGRGRKIVDLNILGGYAILNFV